MRKLKSITLIMSKLQEKTMRTSCNCVL